MSDSDPTDPEASASADTATTGDLTPPYGGYRPFWTFIEELRASGEVPQQIDNSVLGNNRSGAARSQLLVALRFFGLIAERKPTERLQHLVLSEAPEQEFAEFAREAYAPLIAINLKSATANQLNDALLAMGAGGGDTLRKTRLFFQSVAEVASIEMGPHLRKRATTSAAPRPRKAPKGRTVKVPSDAIATATDQPGMRHAVDLRSGGKVSVVVTVNLFDLDHEDMQFVIGLVDSLKAYRGTAKSTLAPKTL